MAMADSTATTSSMSVHAATTRSSGTRSRIHTSIAMQERMARTAYRGLTPCLSAAANDAGRSAGTIRPHPHR